MRMPKMPSLGLGRWVSRRRLVMVLVAVLMVFGISHVSRWFAANHVCAVGAPDYAKGRYDKRCYLVVRKV